MSEEFRVDGESHQKQEAKVGDYQEKWSLPEYSWRYWTNFGLPIFHYVKGHFQKHISLKKGYFNAKIGNKQPQSKTESFKLKKYSFMKCTILSLFLPHFALDC